MMNSLKLLLVACFATLIASTTYSATTQITLLPTYGGAAGIGGIQGNFAPGFTSGSWDYNQGPNGKGEVYIDPLSLFSGAVTIGDIASISYWTNKPTTPSNVDWSFYIYTQPTGSLDTGSFYHSRLVSEPYLSPNGASYTANAWTQWNSNPTTGLRVYDTARDGGVFGTTNDPFLDAALNGPVTYANNNTVDYTGETVKYFSIQTGSVWSNGFTGLVDGLMITLKNGDVGIVNFEAVPEASSWIIAALAAGLLGVQVSRARAYSRRSHALSGK